MAFHFNFTLIKKHPYASAGVIVVGGLVLYLLLHGSSSSSTTSSSGVYDQQSAITTQANAQLALQQDAEQSQYQMAALSATTSQNIQTLKAYEDITLGTQANNNQALEINKQADVSLAGISAQQAIATLQSNNQTQVQIAGIAANEQMQQNQLNAAISQTNTNAALQAHLADTNAQLQQNLSNINAQAAISGQQINANTQVSIANIQAGTAKHSSDNSSWVSTVGTIAGIAAAFL